MTDRPRIVIVGGGFGGLECAQRLARSQAEVIVLDRQNHHCFQPLLYQVATATLSPADVAWPIRTILQKSANTQVLMANVTGVDVDTRRVLTEDGAFDYDILVLASGATHSYFGHDDWAPFAPGLKRIDDATAIRKAILLSFEKAELAADEAERRRHLTFVVVGGGPTGVEMAGAIANVAHEALPADFRNFDPRQAQILLIEAGPRLLTVFPENLSAYAARTLKTMGVTVMTGVSVTDIGRDYVEAGDQRIEAGAVIWAAGVKASPAAVWLGAAADRSGRVMVESDLTIPGNRQIFVIGDTAAVRAEAGLVPGIAPAAKQMGAYVAEVIKARLAGADAPPAFSYSHAGDLATIGRRIAIVKLDRFELTGFIAWLFWSLAHVYFLITLRNRIAVAFTWAWDYVTFGRRARLITHLDEPPP